MVVSVRRLGFAPRVHYDSGNNNNDDDDDDNNNNDAIVSTAFTPLV